MTQISTFDSKISREGRATVPAEVRRALGVTAGDRIQFVVDGGDVRVVTGRALTIEIWANNHGGDAGDSSEDVRAARTEDNLTAKSKWGLIAESESEPDPRPDEEVEAQLLASLGLK